MAVRLSVVMIQSPPPMANAERIAEAVVGELIGLGGIDLTLVEPLPSLSESSTDHLTLSSLTGDIAFLDWQKPAETLEALGSLGIVGQRSAHQHDFNVPVSVSNQRKFYLFDLMNFADAKEVIAALSELNASRSVRTFSLDLAPKTRVSPNPRNVVNPANTSDALDSSVTHMQLSAESAADEPESLGDPLTVRERSVSGTDSKDTDGSRSEVDRPNTSAAEPVNREDTNGMDLDDLIDQLDRLDP